MILFEVLNRKLMLVDEIKNDPRKDAQAYAERVARGFRPEIPRKWPTELAELISSCWAQVRGGAGFRGGEAAEGRERAQVARRAQLLLYSAAQIYLAFPTPHFRRIHTSAPTSPQSSTSSTSWTRVGR